MLKSLLTITLFLSYIGISEASHDETQLTCCTSGYSLSGDNLRCEDCSNANNVIDIDMEVFVR